MAESEHVHVEAHAAPGVLLERYVYPPGPPGELPRHAHEAYQLCVGFELPGEYRYRGARLGVPTGAVTVLHPGEPHAARDPDARPVASRYWMMYLDPARVASAAAQLGNARAGAPFFADPVLRDGAVARAFVRCFSVFGDEPGDGDGRLALFLDVLLRRAGIVSEGDVASGARARPELERAREFLHGNAARSVALAEVAAVAGMSVFHFARAFRQRFGLPPHEYQTMLRVERAKPLLAAGARLTEVAAETGFVDQSHFGRHFKRFTGTTPGRYRAAARRA